jgi:hypothetical protein
MHESSAVENSVVSSYGRNPLEKASPNHLNPTPSFPKLLRATPRYSKHKITGCNGPESDDSRLDHIGKATTPSAKEKASKVTSVLDTGNSAFKKIKRYGRVRVATSNRGECFHETMNSVNCLVRGVRTVDIVLYRLLGFVDPTPSHLKTISRQMSGQTGSENGNNNLFNFVHLLVWRAYPDDDWISVLNNRSS